MPAPATWHVAASGGVQRIVVTDTPRPLALYEMVHPAGTKRAGQVCHIVIYTGALTALPTSLAEEEVGGVIALAPEQ